MSTQMEPMKLIVTIVERHQGGPLAEFYSAQGLSWHYQCCGLGTASSDLLDVLGFGTSERDILFSLGSKTAVDTLMYDLNTGLRSQVDAKGIAFDLPLTAINQLVALMIMEEAQEDKKGAVVMTHGGNHSLVLVAVNQGNTDDVMDTAKKAGARGGTILRARWLGTEESQHILGITLQSEKEIIAILVPTQNRNLVMEEINKKHGIRSQAQAMICSLGVEQVVRFH